MQHKASGLNRFIFWLALICLVVVLSTLQSCTSKKDSGWGELEETVPPSGCTILRKKIEEENKKNGTNKVAQC